MAKCKDPKNVKFAHDGRCVIGPLPCDDLGTCFDFVYDPVCGSNGKTYREYFYFFLPFLLKCKDEFSPVMLRTFHISRAFFSEHTIPQTRSGVDRSLTIDLSEVMPTLNMYAPKVNHGLTVGH